MGEEQRDPEQAIDDIRDEVAEGDEPDADERAFLESEKVDVPRGAPPLEPEGR